MQKVIIGLSKSKSFSPCGKCIQLFQGTDYTHAYFRFHSKELKSQLIYQATGIGVNFANLKDFQNQEVIIKEWELKVSDKTYHKILKFCAEEVGKPYSIKAIIGILFYILFGLKLINSDKLNTFICSELVGYILQMIGIIGKDVDLDYFTPKDVFNTLNR